MERLGFQGLVEETLTVKRVTRAMRRITNGLSRVKPKSIDWGI